MAFARLAMENVESGRNKMSRIPFYPSGSIRMNRKLMADKGICNFKWDATDLEY
jgi:hypothetical protein